MTPTTARNAVTTETAVEDRSETPLPLPRYIGLRVPSSLEGAYNRGWNACLEAMRTGRNEFGQCAFCHRNTGHDPRCPAHDNDRPAPSFGCDCDSYHGDHDDTCAIYVQPTDDAATNGVAR